MFSQHPAWILRRKKVQSIALKTSALIAASLFLPLLFFLAKVVWGWNDPVAMYPLQATEKDKSRCANGDAEYVDDERPLSWPTELKFPVDNSTRVVRITNNNGNFKLKDMTMIILFRASDRGMRTLAQFVAHEKPILLLSLDDLDLHFSLHSKCENKTRIKKLKLVARNTAIKQWTFAAVTYNQTSGYATLYAGGNSTHSAHWGYVNIEEPQEIYLGNNIEFMTEASHDNGQKSPKNFFGKMKCFILYRRTLDFSQITNVKRFCRKIVRKYDHTDDDDTDDDDTDDDDTDDDESHADDKIGSCKHEIRHSRKYLYRISFAYQGADDFFIHFVHSTRFPNTP